MQPELLATAAAGALNMVAIATRDQGERPAGLPPRNPIVARALAAAQTRQAAPGATRAADPAPEDEEDIARADDEGADAEEEDEDPVADPPPRAAAPARQRAALSVAAALNLRQQGTAIGVAADAIDRILARPGQTEAGARAAIMATAARGQTDIRIPGRATDTNQQARMEAAADGLLLRTRPTLAGKFDAQRVARARDFRGMGFVRLAEEVLSWSGRAITSRDPSALVRAALATTDYPALLMSSGERALRDAYESLPLSFTEFSRQVNVRDFRERTSISFGGLGSFDRVPQGGPATYAAPTEHAEKWAVDLYERLLNISFHALTNDDLDAFARQPDELATAANITQREVFYAMFAGNGPIMSDGKTLFHADHGNLGSAGASPPSAATLSTMRRAMRRQKSHADKSLNIKPSFVLSPTLHETTLDQLFATLQAGLNVPRSELVTGPLATLRPIVDPELDRHDENDWYGLADPIRSGFEHGYLDGDNGLVIEQLPPGEVSGINLKARIVFGCGVVDWRGVYKQPHS